MTSDTGRRSGRLSAFTLASSLLVVNLPALAGSFADAPYSLAADAREPTPELPQPDARTDSVFAEAYYRTGLVEGHAQVAAGGEPGTTSHKRPTFHELG